MNRLSPKNGGRRMNHTLTSPAPAFQHSEAYEQNLTFLEAANAQSKKTVEDLRGLRARIRENGVQIHEAQAHVPYNETYADKLREYVAQIEDQSRQMIGNAQQLQSGLLQNLMQACSYGSETVSALIGTELLGWRVKQKHAQYKPRRFQQDLKQELDEKLEKDFENCGRELRQLKSSIDFLLEELNGPNNNGNNERDQAMQLSATAQSLIMRLIEQSCVIAQQPPAALIQVRPPRSDSKHIRRDNHMTCQPVIRLLGGMSLGLRASDKAQVKAFLISEDQARLIHEQNVPLAKAVNLKTVDEAGQKGVLLHNETKFEVVEGTYSAKFNPPIQLVKIKRPGSRPSEETIPQQRYHLCFAVTLYMGSQQLDFCKLSLPLGSLVHPRQFAAQGGDAYIFWEHAFSQGDGILTPVPRESNEGVPWPEFAIALNWKFMQLIEGSKPDYQASEVRGISGEAMNHIAEKLFGAQHNSGPCQVTWEQFFKGPPNGSFREWFFKAADVVEKHLLPQWNAGLILGFASKSRAESILKSIPEPTMLIKFSDSRPGSVIISYHKGLASGEPVRHLSLMNDDLTAISLESALTVNELQGVLYIYPAEMSQTGSIRSVSELRVKKNSEEERKDSDPNSDEPPDEPYAFRIRIKPCVEGLPAPMPLPHFPYIPAPFPLSQDDLSNAGSPQSMAELEQYLNPYTEPEPQDLLDSLMTDFNIGQTL